MSETLSLKQFARLAGYSEIYTYVMIREGRLVATKRGNRWSIPLREAVRLKARHELWRKVRNGSRKFAQE